MDSGLETQSHFRNDENDFPLYNSKKPVVICVGQSLYQFCLFSIHIRIMVSGRFLARLCPVLLSISSNVISCIGLGKVSLISSLGLAKLETGE